MLDEGLSVRQVEEIAQTRQCRRRRRPEPRRRKPAKAREGPGHPGARKGAAGRARPHRQHRPQGQRRRIAHQVQDPGAARRLVPAVESVGFHTLNTKKPHPEEVAQRRLEGGSSVLSESPSRRRFQRLLRMRVVPVENGSGCNLPPSPPAQYPAASSPRSCRRDRTGAGSAGGSTARG